MFTLSTGHKFHIVDPSPWPFLISLGAGVQLPIGAVMYMHGEADGFFILINAFFLLVVLMSLWWYDIIIEGTYQNMHTEIVQRGLRLGFLLFIISEIMFFASFFWAFFHSALAPTVEIMSIWLPPRLQLFLFKPYKVPLLNTLILLCSGIYVTAAHAYVVQKRANNAAIFYSFLWTVLLALAFTVCQFYEYSVAQFDISDGIYASLFYVMTGFHGIHVIIGTVFIFVAMIRYFFKHFTPTHHIGLEAAVWYWHFVDVVWLLLFCAVYWWTSAPLTWQIGPFEF